MIRRVQTGVAGSTKVLAGVLIGVFAIVGMVETATADPSDYGLQSVAATESTAQAGAHPDVTIDFNLKTDPSSATDSNGYHESYGILKDTRVKLPPGLSGDPNAVPRCTIEQFASFASEGEGCPIDTQVGVIHLRLYKFLLPLTEPIYNLVPSGNQTVARLGFYTATLPYFMNIHVRSGSDYGLTAAIENPPASSVVGATTELWGVPADHSHDKLRLTPFEAFPMFRSESPPRSVGAEPKPFLSNPTSCGVPLRLAVETDSYSNPGAFSSLETPFPTTAGCDKLDFSPSLSVLPTSREAGAAGGIETVLKIPQSDTPNDLATAQLRAARVTLPRGISISPAAADGLSACSDDQVQMGSDIAADCPESARIGSLELDVPPLSRPMQGAIYQRTPLPGHLFRLWLVSDELGVHVKIPGEVHADPSTGQLTTEFLDTPQVPVRELKLRFKSGSHGVLANPDSCGVFAASYELEPWSNNPPSLGSAPMTIDEGCEEAKFSPNLKAGTVNASAGRFTPLVLTVSRQARESNIETVEASLPPGLLARLKGVPLCASAAAAVGNCNASTQIGKLLVSVGPGSTPLWVPQPGKEPTAVYLAGPYEGAPYSIVFRVPAQAGPFDLGTVVTRAGVYVDPTTTQVTVKSDRLPQILEGVPLSYRTIHVRVDRSRFTFNPTNCRPASVESRIVGASGMVARPSARFRVRDCDALPFTPRLSLHLSGGLRRTAYPALTAVMTSKKGQANLRRISVALPHAEFLAQEHIRTVCTRVQFAQDRCPRGSVYGTATVSTPLLDHPLRGPVYLRSSSHVLPDLVLALRGQIDVDVAGQIDSFRGGMRTTFNSVPDAPFTKLTLKMRGGRRGLLRNSINLCQSRTYADVKMEGQNGDSTRHQTKVDVRCG